MMMMMMMMDDNQGSETWARTPKHLICSLGKST